MTTLTVGDVGNYRDLLCTIVDQEGGSFTLETPHGSRIKLGFFCLASNWRALTPSEQTRFDELIADAASK